MGSPEFILALRKKIGHDPLWLPGVRAVVFDAEGKVLLGERSGTGGWALITGILEPGEDPAPGMVREIFEETAVVAKIEHLLGVAAVGPVTFPNGDVCDFLNIEFIARHVSGTARVNDDESLAVGWFAVADLPPLRPGHLDCIQRALDFTGSPHFQR